jgi:Putative adhesin
MYLLTLPLLAALTGTDTTVTVSAGGKLELRNHEGPVTVTVWNRQAVRVRAEHDDESRVSVDVSGNTVRVTGRGRYGPEPIAYELTVPADMALEIFAQEGEVRVTGSRAALEIQSIEGSITVEGGRGSVRLNSVEGDLIVRGASGRLDLETVDGDVSASDLEGDLEVTTVDGDILLQGMRAASVEASTVDGDITMAGEIKAEGRYRLSSHEGDVTLTAPVLDATVSVSTFEGDFTSDFPVTVNTAGRKMSFTLGNGRARIELESFDGEVALRKGTGR